MNKLTAMITLTLSLTTINLTACDASTMQTIQAAINETNAQIEKSNQEIFQQYNIN